MLKSSQPRQFQDHLLVISPDFIGCGLGLADSIGAFEKALSTFDITDISDKVNYSDKSDELKQLGYINDYNGDANRVYDGETIARALKAEAGGGGAKTGWYALRSPEVDHGESQN